jgi:hypothetical protein
MSFPFPISDRNVLDWVSVCFRGTFNDPHRHRRLHPNMVDNLDTDSMRKRTPSFEQGQRDT